MNIINLQFVYKSSNFFKTRVSAPQKMRNLKVINSLIFIGRLSFDRAEQDHGGRHQDHRARHAPPSPRPARRRHVRHANAYFWHANQGGMMEMNKKRIFHWVDAHNTYYVLALPKSSLSYRLIRNYCTMIIGHPACIYIHIFFISYNLSKLFILKINIDLKKVKVPVKMYCTLYWPKR